MTQFPDPSLSWHLKGNVMGMEMSAEAELVGKAVSLWPSHLSASVAQSFRLHSGDINELSIVLSTVLGP